MESKYIKKSSWLWQDFPYDENQENKEFWSSVLRYFTACLNAAQLLFYSYFEATLVLILSLCIALGKLQNSN